MSELAPTFYLQDDDTTFTGTVATAGPWSESLQHGGPPSALMVRAAERAADREDAVALRVAVDFLSAVPVGLVHVSAEVAKAGRATVAVDVRLDARDRQVARARVWLVRVSEGPRVEPPADAGPRPAGNEPAQPLWGFPYAQHVEWRRVSGTPDAPGPAHVLARPRVPLVDDEPADGLARVVLVGDSGSGISSVLDWDAWSFPNVDLDVHLLRPVAGEWVGMDAVTRVSSTGSAQCCTTLHDEAGWLGTGLQTLVVQRR